MISTFQGLLVAVLALLPGAAYTFALERVTNGYGAASFSDRLVRFLAASAAIHALLAGGEYQLYRYLIAEHRLGNGTANVWLLQGLSIGYVLLPTAVGSTIGWGHKHHKKWAVLLVGAAPEPRAWDYMWRHTQRAIVRIKLKSGTWLAGYYGWSLDGRRSYASAHPEEGDLYLAVGLTIDADSGELVLDEKNQTVPLPDARGLLVRWPEIEYIDIKAF
ncbi:DUF6338 family protein [Amycolatopsis sp. SID8362]|uniref:DUF6338 family protein n=1 Tax=Amycolatopsis sp. SID8362 TaxID=2690346 RepID=UPI00136E2EE2|nr:DUF6338 family protein [Amycolatopsis sp. SID8362]NBH10355.1 hypothetical protein [Amycolatopsis sp. SID8362]NED47050.1 hypothetical protein [Amycolatopsis sp. SID8362]